MSKDQKSMGRRNVIRTAPYATDPLPPRITSATKVAFVHPLGDVTQAWGSRLTMFGYRQKIAFYLKVTGQGLLSYMFISDGRQKSWAMRELH